MIKSYHHGNLRQTVIRAAREQITHHGAAALNLRAIAREIGVTHPAVYRHFKDKDSLLQELALQGFHELADNLELACQEPSVDFSNKLNQIATAYIEFSLVEPELSRIMFGFISADVRLANTRLYEASKRSFTLLNSTISNNEGNNMHNAVVVWAMFHGLSQLTLERQITHLSNPEERKKIISKAVNVLAQGFSKP